MPASSETPSCAVVVPAFNEAATVASVVAAARDSDRGPVWVVDDGSTDGTAEAARAAGAQVLALPANAGKGGAVAAVARALDHEVLVLLDADLVGLCPRHVQALADPVLSGRADMTRGVFRGGRWTTSAAQRIAPQLNGQRALRRRALLEVAGLAASRYGMEVMIANHARAAGWRCLDVPLQGVTQVMKEEKRGVIAGLRHRLAMYRDIVVALLRRDADASERS